MPNGIKFNDSYPVIEKSDAIWERSLGLIPAGGQTMAKSPGLWSEGVAPKFLSHGVGGHSFDVDGNEYIDMTMGVGPLSLGYCDPDVDAAVVEQLKKGITFSLISPLEVEVAELVREVIPNVEMVRYSKTGADVCSAAIRLARAFTGREKVLACGYHGWHDWYISVTTRNAGIPQAVQDLTHTFAYNDLASVERSLDSDTAAIILEPATFIAPEPGFLEGLRELCDKNGTLLIFDEMWTGFRLAVGGAQERFGVRADLAVFSKAIANGMPLSVICGRADVMSLLEGPVFCYTTFGGEALSLAAAKVTINKLREHNVPQQLETMGNRLREGFLAKKAELELASVNCLGFGARTLVSFTPDGGDPLVQKTLVQQELIKRGVLWNGTHNLCMAHTEADIDHTIAAWSESLTILKEAIDGNRLEESLVGKPLIPVFRKNTDFDSKPVKKG